MFLLAPTRNMFAGKFVKWVRFLALLREYIFCNVDWVEVCKMNKVFWAKSYCKTGDRFCWLWDFLLKNLKLKDKVQICGFESFIFWSKVRLFGTVLARFSQCNFKIFLHFYSDIPHHHKTASYGSDNVHNHLQLQFGRKPIGEIPDQH